MGINIIDKISEFSFNSELRGKVTISAEQLRGEKCKYTFVDGETQAFFGTIKELWDYQKDQKAIVKTLGGEEQRFPVRLYVVEDREIPSDKLGAYLTTVKRIE